jgi:hypothetical protein
MYIKHHIKICRWYLLVVILNIDIKYTFLVRFHIFSPLIEGVPGIEWAPGFSALKALVL